MHVMFIGLSHVVWYRYAFLYLTTLYLSLQQTTLNAFQNIYLDKNQIKREFRFLIYYDCCYIATIFHD